MDLAGEGGRGRDGATFRWIPHAPFCRTVALRFEGVARRWGRWRTGLYACEPTRRPAVLVGDRGVIPGVEVAAVGKVGPATLRHPWEVLRVDLETPVLAIVLADALIAAVAGVGRGSRPAAVCIVCVVVLHADGLCAGIVGRVGQFEQQQQQQQQRCSNSDPAACASHHRGSPRLRPRACPPLTSDPPQPADGRQARHPEHRLLDLEPLGTPM